MNKIKALLSACITLTVVLGMTGCSLLSTNDIKGPFAVLCIDKASGKITDHTTTDSFNKAALVRCKAGTTKVLNSNNSGKLSRQIRLKVMIDPWIKGPSLSVSVSHSPYKTVLPSEPAIWVTASEHVAGDFNDIVRLYNRTIASPETSKQLLTGSLRDVLAASAMKQLEESSLPTASVTWTSDLTPNKASSRIGAEWNEDGCVLGICITYKVMVTNARKILATAAQDTDPMVIKLTLGHRMNKGN